MEKGGRKKWAKVLNVRSNKPTTPSSLELFLATNTISHSSLHSHFAVSIRCSSEKTSTDKGRGCPAKIMVYSHGQEGRGEAYGHFSIKVRSAKIFRNFVRTSFMNDP